MTADPYRNPKSLEFRFRVGRFVHIRRLIEDVLAEHGSARIVDLGGTERYWLIGADFIRENRDRLKITVVNTSAQTIEDSDIFEFVHASATDQTLCDDMQFDVVHSNSVIEHVGDFGEMRAFAENVRRLAPRYFVQTPNYGFPYEPHFRFPGFQYLPREARLAMMQKVNLGFIPRSQTREDAIDVLDHHRLLSTREMKRLFPDATIIHEKFWNLNKSIIAVRDK